MEHAADTVTFVIVERLVVDAGNCAAAIEHQVLANQAARVREAIGELLVCGKQKQTRCFSAIGADDHGFGFLEMRVAFLVEINCTDGTAIGIQFDAMNIRIGADFAAASALGHANRSH